jgi:Flp pilus assembly protein TadD
MTSAKLRLACASLGVAAITVGLAILVERRSATSDAPGVEDPSVAHPSATPAAAKATAGRAEFVGRSTCGECHAAELAGWSGSDHDLAMQTAEDGTVLGDFSGTKLEHFGVETTFFRRDGKFRVRTDGPDGQPQEYEIAYTFGVRPLQQYLIAFPGGRLQALSVAWDSRPREEGGQRWFHLYPDEPIPAGDLLHWTGFAQNWNARCAECHSTNLRKSYDAGEDRYDTTWSEIDVSCEACHGPGSSHVAWAREATAARSGIRNMGLVVDLGERKETRWVMDAATGIARPTPVRSSHSEVEACGRCHARRSVVTEPYAHGRPLMDTHRPALLGEQLYFADGQVKDEVYEYGSFLQSRMYAAGVTCSDCHDPHSLKLRAGGADATCAQCHLPGRFATPEHHHHPVGSPGASCVACHMPSRTYMVVDPRRDHGFRIPRPDVATKIGAPDACTSCHAGRTQEWAAQALTSWGATRSTTERGFAETLSAAQRGSARAADLVDILRSSVQPGIVRATAVVLLWDIASPGDLPSLEASLHDADPLVRSAAVAGTRTLAPDERVRWAAPLLRDPIRTVRIDAARALGSVPEDRLPADDRAALGAALLEYRRALVANADDPSGQLSLGVLSLERGDPAEAERAYRAAMRIAPSLPQAYVNLADLYRGLGREAEGEQVLRSGLTRSPESAELHHALGLNLVRQGRREEATSSLRRAAELAPERPRFTYVLAVALADGGRREEALTLLRDARARGAGDRDVLLALATMSRDAGDRNAALNYARELEELVPSDPGVQRLVVELSSQAR